MGQDAVEVAEVNGHGPLLDERPHLPVDVTHCLASSYDRTHLRRAGSRELIAAHHVDGSELEHSRRRSETLDALQRVRRWAGGLIGGAGE